MPLSGQCVTNLSKQSLQFTAFPNFFHHFGIRKGKGRGRGGEGADTKKEIGVRGGEKGLVEQGMGKMWGEIFRRIGEGWERQGWEKNKGWEGRVGRDKFQSSSAKLF